MPVRRLSLLAMMLTVGCSSMPSVGSAPVRPETTKPSEDAVAEVGVDVDADSGAAGIVELPAPIAVPEPWDFTLEESERWEGIKGGLGTMAYPPSEAEKPFYDRWGKGAGFGGLAAIDTLPKKPGEWVTWLGVLRGYRIDKARDQTRILVESKYFDGLTDTHILCVSFHGGGDFVAILPGTGHGLNGLSLVRVYGEIESVKDNVPRVRAEFIREFPLGQYCFMNFFGEDASNPRWRELCKPELAADEDAMYSPFPDLDYYIARIGHPRDFVEGKIKVDVPLD